MMVRIEFTCDKCGIPIGYDFEPKFLSNIGVYYKCVACYGQLVTRKFLINFEEL